MPDTPSIKEQEAEVREKLEQLQHRGAQAKEVLEDDVMVEALTRYETTIFKLWQDSDPSEKDKREQLYHQFRAGRSFRLYLTSVRDHGKSATQTAARILGHGSSAESS